MFMVRYLVSIWDGIVLQKNSIETADNDINTIVKKAGYQKLTPVQQKVIPTMLQGKDLIVETKNSRGKTAAFILPLIQQINSGSSEIQALIITSDSWGVKKVEKQFRLFAAQSSSSHIIGVVGYEKNIKKELHHLKQTPDILIGTSHRIIDHIRRENINITSTGTVIIHQITPREDEEFTRDIQYILSKIGKKPQIVYFTPQLIEEESFDVFSRKPQIISLSAHQIPRKESCYYLVADQKEKVKTVLDLALQNSFTRSFIVCRSSGEVNLLTGILQNSGFRCATVFEKDIETRFHSGNVDILITTFEQMEHLQFDSAGHIIFFDLPEGEILCSRLQNQIVAFLITRDETSQFNRLQERCNMSIQKEEKPERKNALKGVIERNLKKIKEEEDPEELNYYKKIIRQHVPLTLRAYFTAFLLKQSLGSAPVLSGDFKTLFVSIGKNRRVFPKDLVRLFSQTLDIDRSTIGGIKVMDNYSFVDIPESEADKAISLLDGKDFHGRKITVNHARKKENDRR